MADVADHQSSNRMSERAIAIVMCPNLYEVEPPSAPGGSGGALDPMAALEHSQTMAKLITELLIHYINVRVRVRSSVSVAAAGIGVTLEVLTPPPQIAASDVG